MTAAANPLLTASPLPYGLPPYPDIRPEHYLPAFEAAFAEQRSEIGAITRVRSMPTFENTMVPFERSGALLDAVARALDLDATGRAHLGNLVGAPSRRRAKSRPVQRVRPGLYQLLDSLDNAPATVLGRHTDVLASNRAARVLFADFDAMPPAQRNYARWMFTSPQARELFVDWEIQARSAVENLRLDVGGDPNDPAAAALVDELSSASREFRSWWSEHRVFQRTYGTKRLRHPVVGELSVDFETFTMPGDAEQTLFVYTTAPGSPSRDALNLLLSWSSTRPVDAGDH